MKSVFADTSYFVALLNARDAFHQAADGMGRTLVERIVTSQWILLELTNYFAASRQRTSVGVFVESFLADSNSDCVEVSPAAFVEGWRLYRERPDKAWSLTDCISFNIMQQRKIQKALTTDHHFEQAGFEILLK